MERVINAKAMGTKEVNKTIKKVMKNDEKIYVQNVSELDNVAVGIQKNVRIVIRNDVGDLIGALNDGAAIQIEGSAGRYAADGMTAGEVIIEGDVDDGAGIALCGGTLVVKGDAKNNVGQLLKGGRIIVGGNVGDYAGSFMIAGVLIIGGDAGRQLGSSMVGGAIYIKGDYETLGTNVRRTELTENDKRILRELFAKYQLNLNTERFRKIVTQEKRLL